LLLIVLVALGAGAHAGSKLPEVGKPAPDFEVTLMPVQKVVSFPMVRRFKGDYGKIKALPTNVVIDRNGIVRYSEAGAFDLDGINEVLIPLLNEPAPTS
jgi:hypothetical protein